jgi:hypothetical protein
LKIVAENVRDVDSGRRVEFTVVWEECERPAQTLFFEAIGEGADRYHLSSDALLLAAALPAIEAGERRIALPGSICPKLAAGLASAEILFRKWFGSGRLPLLEPSHGLLASRPPREPRAAAFFSGGVDSTFMLRKNREYFSAGHPAALRHLVLVFGRDYCGDEKGAAAKAALDRTRAWIQPEARRHDAALRVVITNARTLRPDVEFFGYRYQSAYLAAAVHGWSNEVSSASVGSGWDISHLIPWGTHPLIDRWWSSAALALRHEDVGFSRFEKLEYLARSPGAVRHLIVCNEGRSQPLPNCGACFKCVETLAALTALGVAEQAESFPKSLSAEAIDGVTLAPNLRRSFAEYMSFWDILAERLLVVGRRELSRAVRRKLRDARRHQAWLAERDWKGMLRRVDRGFLGGSLTRKAKMIRRGR